MDNDSIYFHYNFLPNHPFIWIYGNFMLPLLSSKKLESIDNFPKNIISDEFYKILEMLTNYKIDFYEVTQNFNDNDTLLNISFHTWYFSNINNSNDMSNIRFKLRLFSGIYIENNEDNKIILNIKESDNTSGIPLNTTELRWCSVHNNKLSPEFDNSFKINKNDISFISVVYCTKIKKACITLHNLKNNLYIQ